jgi:hypothetical protein
MDGRSTRPLPKTMRSAQRSPDAKRRGWDSNPRTPCDANGFRDCLTARPWLSRKPNPAATHRQGNVLGNETRIRSQDARLSICGHQDDRKSLTSGVHSLPPRRWRARVDERRAVGKGRVTLDRKIDGFIHDRRRWRPFEIGFHALHSTQRTARAKCLVCACTADAVGMIEVCRRSAASLGSPSSCSSTITASRTSMLAMRKEKPRSESTIWRSWTATSVAASCDSSLPGQSSIKKNWKRTGAEHERVRHFWRSSHCNERSNPRHHDSRGRPPRRPSVDLRRWA